MQFSVCLDWLFILCSSCSPTPQVNPEVGSSHLDPTASASSLLLVALAFEEAAASQAAEESQAGSEPLGKDDAASEDAIFGHEDAWGIL
jgi:hypothetical protein